MSQRQTLVVIGGGAAGFFAAVNAARLNRLFDVVLLEKTTKLLTKVRVSGGGRCNVTHACFDAADLVKFYPRGGKELRGAFSRFAPAQTIAWFEERGIELHTEADGRMFPVTNDSETIARCLLDEAVRWGVRIQTQTEVLNILPEEKGVRLDLSDGKTMYAHAVIDPVPSLFTFNLPKNPITELMGVSVPKAEVKIRSTKLNSSGPLLVTHWGMSGPAVLKASAWGARDLANLQYNFQAQVAWIPDLDVDDVFEHFLKLREQQPTKTIGNSVSFGLPARLWNFLLQKSGMKEAERWADLSNARMRKWAEAIAADVYEVRGKTTFKEEFVTAGGVALSEIDFKTMQSKRYAQLFFAGEILDIDGVTGGFNFQAAWTTAWIAACSVSGLGTDSDLV
ncbi:MAG: aminoacetone oxidase family FAD-binding enzyme [Bacteroidia bacterium]